MQVAEVASLLLMEGDWLLKYSWMRLVIYLLTIQTNNHFFSRTVCGCHLATGL